MATEYVMSSIATESLKEILRTQVADKKTIWTLTADSVAENVAHIRELSMPMLGIKVYKGDKVRFSMPYSHEKKNKVTGLQHNQITGTEIDKITALLVLLNIVDVPVTELSLLIESPELTGILKKYCGCNWIRNSEKYYIARFVSEQCDGDHDKKKFRSFDINKNLVKKYKFKHFVLNLKYLIDLTQYKTLPYPRRQPIVDAWKKRYIETQNPYRLAKTLKDIWGEYGMTKHFKKDKEDRLVLVKVS